MVDKKNRIESIQSLRAIAFLEIFLGHCGIEFFAGSFGVSIFVILSGFCMAINYLPKAESFSLSPVKNVKYGISKVKKLYGLHLIMLAVTYFMVGMPTSGRAIKRLVVDILLLKCWRPHSQDYYSYNGVAWYLSMYLFVCMLSPYVMRLTAKIKEKKQVYAISAAVYLFMLAVGFYVSRIPIEIGDGFAKWLTYICPFYRVLDFSLGVMLGWLYLSSGRKEQKNIAAATVLEVLAAAAFIIIELVYPGVKAEYMGIGYTVYFIPVSLLIVYVFAKNDGIITKMLNNRCLVWLGNRSSMTFMIHQIVIRWLYMKMDREVLGNGYLLVMILCSFAITIAGTFVYQQLQKILQK